MTAILETIFDICYLITVVALGVTMIRQSAGRRQYILFGITAVVLGCGDAFHLIPRVIALCTNGLGNHVYALGVGKMITSITMTAFYVLLYHVWRERYSISGRRETTLAVYALAAVRVILCLLPQNGWTQPNPSLLWAILRNVPFTALGVLIIVLFMRSVKEKGDRPFRWIASTIIISFACYIPVTIWSGTFPMVGILMIPKTCAYLGTVLIGFRAMKGEKSK